MANNGEFMVYVETLYPVGYFGCNTYVIQSQNEYSVIDPSVDYEIAISKIPNMEGKIKYILLTHAHFDHILKINTWIRNGVQVFVGTKDAPALSDPYRNCYLGFYGVNDGYYGKYNAVNEGFSIKLGDELISVIESPGHTVGGVSYLIGNNLFVGDTIFEGGGYGRCDLPGGDIGVLENSIFKILCMSDDIIIYPGHGNTTTIKDSRKYFM